MNLTLTDDELRTARNCIEELLGMHLHADYEAEALSDKITAYLDEKEELENA